MIRLRRAVPLALGTLLLGCDAPISWGVSDSA
jgi:hypothetical protein